MRCRCTPGSSVLLSNVAWTPRWFERVDLVLHQGDQRADDQGHPRQNHRGQLIAEALAAAGGHDAEDVAPSQDLLDHLALAGPKPLEPKALVERFLKTDRVVDETHEQGAPATLAR